MANAALPGPRSAIPHNSFHQTIVPHQRVLVRVLRREPQHPLGLLDGHEAVLGRGLEDPLEERRELRRRHASEYARGRRTTWPDTGSRRLVLPLEPSDQNPLPITGLLEVNTSVQSWQSRNPRLAGMPEEVIHPRSSPALV